MYKSQGIEVVLNGLSVQVWRYLTSDTPKTLVGQYEINSKNRTTQILLELVTFFREMMGQWVPQYCSLAFGCAPPYPMTHTYGAERIFGALGIAVEVIGQGAITLSDLIPCPIDAIVDVIEPLSPEELKNIQEGIDQASLNGR